MTILLIDNGSSHITDLANAVHAEPVSYLAVSDIDIADYDKVVLSGRSTSTGMMDRINLDLISHATVKCKPLFGVCYGAEILAMSYKCKLKRLSDLSTGYDTIKFTKKTPIHDGSDVQVFSAHRYVISDTSDAVDTIASSVDTPHELINIRDTHMYGSQFHPEKSKGGINLLHNWMDHSSSSK